MSDISEASPISSKKYEQTSTETLEEMLRYSVFSDEELDVDETLAILNELKCREITPPATTPEEAWEIFKSEYSSSESIYLHCAHEENNQTKYRTDEHKKIRSIRASMRIAIAAAVLVAVLFAGTVTAYAFGYDLWGAIAQWSQDTFGFRTSETHEYPSENSIESSSRGVTKQYDDLQTALDVYGIKDQVAPNWLPERFVLDELKVVSETDHLLIITAMYTNDETSLSIRIAVLYDEPIYVYEKDENDIIDYETNGISHYIMANNNQIRAAWINSNIECSISGNVTKAELIRILDSIYESR